MEKIFVAQRVLTKLVDTEAAVDVALAESAEFMRELLQARKDVEAPMTFADDAQVKLMDAMKALSEARTAMVAVHKELGEARLRLGIRTRMGGIDSGTGIGTTTTGEETSKVVMREVV